MPERVELEQLNTTGAAPSGDGFAICAASATSLST